MSTQPLQMSDLNSLIATKEAAASLDLSIRLAQQIVLKDEGKFPSSADLKQLPRNQYLLLQQLWQTATENSESLTWTAFIETLKTLVTEALTHIVTLKVAYQPTVEQATELSHILQTTYSPNSLLELVYDPTLVAGCQLATNGQQIDFSLKNILSSYSST